jgi:hypothetical protein
MMAALCQTKITHGYDKFHAKSTWDPPQDVNVDDLLGDERMIVGVPAMCVVPIEFDSGLYNEDGSMQLSAC